MKRKSQIKTQIRINLFMIFFALTANGIDDSLLMEGLSQQESLFSQVQEVNESKHYDFRKSQETVIALEQDDAGRKAMNK